VSALVINARHALGDAGVLERVEAAAMAPDVAPEDREAILAIVAELRELDARLDALDAATGATP
jgi:hypothetical protein